jgi:hypothetical protein
MNADRRALAVDDAFAGVADTDTEAVQRCLGVGDGDVVGQGPPPSLRGGVVGLLDDTFAVPAPRRTDRHGHPVVLGDTSKRRSHPTGRRIADRGHPIEPPHPRHTAQGACDLIESVDRVRLILRLGKAPAPLSRVRERADEQRRVRAPAPRGGRVRQINPVPLCFIAGRVIDDRHRATLRGMATLAMRTQFAQAKLASERRIRLVEAELHDLVEQRHRPQMRILDQPFPAEVNERIEQLRTCPSAHARDAFAVQIRADRFAVMAEMASDRRDRPASLAERVCVHIILLCEHETGLPLWLACCRRQTALREPHLMWWTSQGGEFQ